MTMTDPIADMLTRIRNANTVKHETVDVPASNIKKEIVRILLEEGFVRGYDVIEDEKQGIIRIQLKYGQSGERVIQGIKRISNVAEKIVPTMAILYIIGALLVLICNFKAIPSAITLIIKSAFNPSAALGGTTGITISLAIQMGIGRGVFSNEAGLGSAPIAAAAAKTKYPVKQGLISMTGTFIDTIIICTMTGLAIVLTGSFNSGLEGAAMTTFAFENGLPFAIIGKYIVNIGLIFFAFTTIIGWNYYGERCIQYLIGIKGIKFYKIIFIALVGVGPFLSLNLVFIITDIVNGLMALPNLIGLIKLRNIVISETNNFFENINSN